MTSIARGARGRSADPTPSPIPLTGEPIWDTIANLINNHPDPITLCRGVLAELDDRRTLADLCDGYGVRLVELDADNLPDIDGFVAMVVSHPDAEVVLAALAPGLPTRTKAGVVARLLDERMGVPA